MAPAALRALGIALESSAGCWVRAGPAASERARRRERRSAEVGRDACPGPYPPLDAMGKRDLAARAMRFPLSIVLVGLLGPGCVGSSGGGVVPAGGGVGPAGGRAAPSGGAAVEAPSESDGPTSPAEAANGSHVGEPSLEELGAFLDAWHEAASRADADVYLGSIADDGVFLGTDPSERWDKAAFSAYVLPYFEAGRGWTYLPSNRHAAMEGGSPGSTRPSRTRSTDSCAARASHAGGRRPGSSSSTTCTSRSRTRPAGPWCCSWSASRAARATRSPRLGAATPCPSTRGRSGDGPRHRGPARRAIRPGRRSRG